MAAVQSVQPAQQAQMSPSTRLPDEETPLLAGNEPLPTGGVGTSTAATGREQTITADEPSDSKLVLILGSTYVGVFLGALDATVIATLTASISTSFKSQTLFAWLATAYLIANAACQPISGRLTDIFSRRTGLVISNVLFALGNLMCGLAGSESTMIAGRIIAGMGGGGLMAIGTFLASDLVPLRKRGIIQGFGNICYGTGAGVGGLFGGWVNDNWGWRLAFLAQVPFALLSGVLVFYFVDVPPKKSEKSKFSRVDFLGVFTLVVTLLLLLLGLNSGGNIVPWSHPLVLIALPLSVVALVAFVWIELRWAAEPVIPVRLLLNRTVASSCLTNWFATGAHFMILFYTPLYFQIKGRSTTESGVRLIPQSVGSSVGSIAAGLIMNKTGKYKALGMALILIFFLGPSWLSLVTIQTPDWPTLIFLFFIGVGYGGMLTVTLLATISAVDHEHQAVITSATYAFRSTGSTIGVTIASAVYQNILNIRLWQEFGALPGAADEIQRIRDSFDELRHLPPGWKDGVVESYMDALRAVFLTAMGVAFLSIVTGSFIRQNILHVTLSRR